MHISEFSRTYQFQDFQIGLARDQVKLVEHNPMWKRLFLFETNFICSHLNEESLRLYHCGSTSIPDLKSKPIIDIVGSIHDLHALDLKKSLFEKIGYEFKGEYGISGRRYCVLYNQHKTEAYVHLHIFKEDSLDFRRHLLFRDYLRSSEEKRAIYQNLKEELIMSGTSRKEYSSKKSELISALEKEAIEILML